MDPGVYTTTFIYPCLIYTYPGICVSVDRYTNTTDTQIFTYRSTDLQMGPVSVWARANLTAIYTELVIGVSNVSYSMSNTPYV